jgi:hypothetical protein
VGAFNCNRCDLNLNRNRLPIGPKALLHGIAATTVAEDREDKTNSTPLLAARGASGGDS